MKSLVLWLSDFDSDPAGEWVFVTLDAAATSGHFSGAASCVVSARDLTAFLDALDSLGRTSTGEALLAGGWGDIPDLRLRISPADRRGHLLVQVLLREARGPEHRSLLETSFETEPQSLLRVSALLRESVVARKPGDFSFFVDGGRST